MSAVEDRASRCFGHPGHPGSFRRSDMLELAQKNGFAIVLLTLVPLLFAAVTSRAGKFTGNLTPWEPAKIPFLIGFAAILLGFDLTSSDLGFILLNKSSL